MVDESLVTPLGGLLRDPAAFCAACGGIRLRAYQAEVMQAVADSVIHKRGLSLVVIFPRQSGKNEVQAQLESYLLTYLREIDAEIVKVSPTWRPQSINAMRRLERVLKKNPLARGDWRKESGYIFRLGQARIFFLSAAPESNIVGATASALLEVDEAQDVETAKFDKDVLPMAAATNATRVFWGTAWTSRTLLARELRTARRLEAQDGRRRVFLADAERVAAEVPKYGHFVAEQTARLGRSHPLVRTQYYSEEIDGEGGLFPPERIARLQGEHAPLDAPLPGEVYVLLLDVAGADESADQTGDPAGWELRNPARDASALTVAAVDLSTCRDPLIQAPTYRCVQRRQWVGVRHTLLYAELRALAEHWRARYLVADATGVGAGLAAFLERALPGKVIPFLFNSASKSQLGWDFLAVADGGRWKEAREDTSGAAGLAAVFRQQLAFCQFEILPGPEKRMRWGVPDGTRDPASGELVHDDLLISAALCTRLDGLDWTAGGETLVVPAPDPLRDLDRGF
jgi:hypothetical protein